MNKAVLLSVLVFPGFGHLLLKKYRTGISLIIASAIALSFLVYNLVQSAMDIIDKIQSGEIVHADEMTISEILYQTDTFQMKIATTILLVLWGFSIVDSYRLSRKQNKEITQK